MELHYHFGRDGEEDYDYEVNDKDLQHALTRIATPEEVALAEEQGSFDELAEQYEDELESWFEDDAREEFRDYKLLKNNPDSYYGVSRRD